MRARGHWMHFGRIRDSHKGKIPNEDLVLSQTRIFGPPPPLPPLSDRFCKKSEKIRIDSEWPETARNRKKNFCPLVTPPRKKLRKIFKNFFENFLKVVQNHLKREKNSKIFFSFFFSYTEKKLRKIFKFFFWKFFESCSESSETWKKLKKKFFIFSLFWVRLGESTPKALGILNH